MLVERLALGLARTNAWETAPALARPLGHLDVAPPELVEGEAPLLLGAATTGPERATDPFLVRRGRCVEGVGP